MSDNGRQMTLPMAQIAKQHGIRIICVGISYAVDKAELSQIASSPNDVILLETYRDLTYIFDPLMASACVNNGTQAQHCVFNSEHITSYLPTTLRAIVNT